MIFYLICLLLTLQNPTLTNLRNYYSDIVNDEKKCTTYLNKLKSEKNNSATVTAFIAALTASGAQFQLNPFSRIATVNDAHELFEKAVSDEPQNPEIRYLRITVEQNTPRFLGLSAHINEDKKIVLDRFDEYVNIAGVESAKQVIAFMKYHKLCTTAELTKLEQWTK